MSDDAPDFEEFVVRFVSAPNGAVYVMIVVARDPQEAAREATKLTQVAGAITVYELGRQHRFGTTLVEL